MWVESFLCELDKERKQILKYKDKVNKITENYIIFVLNYKTKMQQVSASGWTCKDLTLYVLIPFLYSVNTRLPFIVYVIETQKMGLPPLLIATALAVYQGIRALMQYLQGYSLKFSVFLTRIAFVFGFIGFLVNLLVQDQIFNTSSNTRKIIFMCGYPLVAICEILPTIISIMKFENVNESPEQMRYNYRIMYTWVNFGAAFAFGIGGTMYAFKGLEGFGIIGTCSAFLGILATNIYFTFLTDVDTTDVLETEELEMEENAAQNTTDNAAIPWIFYCLAISFGFESMSIGTLLSVGPLFLTEQYNLSTLGFSMLMAGGEFLGFLLSLLVIDNNRRKTFTYFCPNPWTLIVGLGVVAFADICFIFNNKIIGCMCQVLIHGVNAYVVGVMIEMQGAVTNPNHVVYLSSLGQTCRRSMNTCAAFFAPIFYFHVSPRFPFVLIGCGTLLWDIILIVSFCIDRRELFEYNQQKYNTQIATEKANNQSWITAHVDKSTNQNI